MKKKEVLTLSISTGPYAEFVRHIINQAQLQQSKYACLANVHMLIEGHNDPVFASAVNNADIIAPDGKPLTWGLRLLHGIKQDRVAGMDLLPALLSEAQALKISVFFYGGTGSMLQSTSAYLVDSFPALQIAGMHSPPFRSLSADEEEKVVSQINASGAQLVFVVLGCPKQEKWMASMKGRIQAVMIGIGGALPVLIGEQKRAPEWMQEAGLEWLYRFKQEPRRLFKRYAVTNTLFFYLLMKAIIRVHVLKRKLVTA